MIFIIKKIMKLKITEAQLERLKGKLTEGSKDKSGSNSYQREIGVDFTYRNAKLKGHEINDVITHKITVAFEIELDAKQWGVRGISLYNIAGPTDIEIEVDYFVNEDNTDTATLDLKLDWDRLKVETRTGEGIITIDDTLEVQLLSDDQGNLIVDDMMLIVFGL
jgi:hypothetical protein